MDNAYRRRLPMALIPFFSLGCILNRSLTKTSASASVTSNGTDIFHFAFPFFIVLIPCIHAHYSNRLLAADRTLLSAHR